VVPVGRGPPRPRPWTARFDLIGPPLACRPNLACHDDLLVLMAGSWPPLRLGVLCMSMYLAVLFNGVGMVGLQASMFANIGPDSISRARDRAPWKRPVANPALWWASPPRADVRSGRRGVSISALTTCLRRGRRMFGAGGAPPPRGRPCGRLLATPNRPPRQSGRVRRSALEPRHGVLTRARSLKSAAGSRPPNNELTTHCADLVRQRRQAAAGLHKIRPSNAVNANGAG